MMWYSSVVVVKVQLCGMLRILLQFLSILFDLGSFHLCFVVSKIVSSWYFCFFYSDEFVEIVFPSFFGLPKLLLVLV